MSYQIHYTVVYDTPTGEFFLTDTVPPYADQPVWDKTTKTWRSVDEIVENSANSDGFDLVDMNAELRLVRALTEAHK